MALVGMSMLSKGKKKVYVMIINVHNTRFSLILTLETSDGAKAGEAVGHRAKLESGPRVRQPNTRYAWDPS
ncbi:hypothetical protein H5410_040918 [Solanum commersonii]|uniref:Uncharacterized protein n=1 Tax=Solanum commersonii TaxID=4109 RepID=A0A9J5XSY0_SOLCO|nr:hypothetical protein H5410_040918 [Solanum commersonii]